MSASAVKPWKSPEVAATIADRNRMAALRHLVLLDTPPSPPFDRITGLAARLLRAPMALFTLIDLDRQWFKSAHGLAERSEVVATARQTPLDYSLCQYVVAAKTPIAIPDLAADPDLRDHPKAREFGIRSYAGVPLFSPDGFAVGTLCVLDVNRRRWTERNVADLNDLAGIGMREIAMHVRTRLDAHRQSWQAVPSTPW